ncbi:MaoC/PaaZ C-terminal domain-containing protein [Vibrio astriarenae]
MAVLSTMPKYHKELLKVLFSWKKKELSSLSFPDITVQSARIDHAQLDAYNRYFAFVNDAIPLPFWFVFSQPAQLALFNHPEFPVSAMGLVHTGLVIECHTAEDIGDDYQVNVSVKACHSVAKGKQISLLIVIQNNGNSVVTIESEYLSLAPKVRDKTSKAKKAVSNDRPFELADTRQVDYNVAKARKYAKISGDYNPIHIHALLSRLFGFKQPILHGMYSVASLYAYCYKRNVGSDKQMRVKFKRPLLLPQSAHILQLDTRGYLLNSEGKCCVEMVW